MPALIYTDEVIMFKFYAYCSDDRKTVNIKLCLIGALNRVNLRIVIMKRI